MQFLHPWFLAALGTLAIPIIIHLFYFRRFKKVYFSSVRFLREVKDETSSRSKLKNLLVLIARLTVLALLVMAFAQPFSRKARTERYAQNIVGVFVDNSYSMNALSEDIPLLSKAKQRARSIVEAHDGQDRFMILTHDFLGKHQRLVHQEEALSLVDEIIPTPAVHSLAESLLKLENIINKEEGNKHAYLISDFQLSISDLPSTVDTTLRAHLVPLQSIQERNVAIDSAWFDSPAQWIAEPNLLKYKLHNYSDQPVQDARISMTQNGQLKPLGTFNLAAGESKTDTAQVIINKAGWQEIQLEITDFPIQFDDKLFLTFNVTPQLNFLVISNDQANPNLITAIRDLPAANLQVQNARNINYTSLSSQQLIILDDLNDISSGLANELLSATKQGTNVLIFPGATADLRSYSNFLSGMGAGTLLGVEKKLITVTTINTQEFIFKDVYNKVSPNMRLPTVQGRYQRSIGTAGEEKILSFADGQPYLSKIKIDLGAFYWCASPLSTSWADLSANPEIFVPMLFKMALSKNKSDKISRFVGQDDQIELNSSKLNPELAVHLKKTNGEDIIPMQRSAGNKIILDVKGALREDGIYQIGVKDSIMSKVAFNFNRKESDLRTMTLEQIKAQYGANYEVFDKADQDDFDAWFKENQKGKTYWKWFLAGTLLFLLIESMLLRFWK